MASPEGADFGWLSWCTGNEFELHKLTKSFRFTISASASATVLQINSYNDLKSLPRVEASLLYSPLWECLDFEKMLDEGIDAVQLNLSNDPFSHDAEK